MWYVVRAAKEKTMIQKLIEKIQKTKAPICVGLDPMVKLYSGIYFKEVLQRVW